jgi:transposase-like protein
MSSVLSEPYFHDEAAAFEALERIVWPNGPHCPHCGNADAAKIGRLAEQRTKPSQKHPKGKPVHGLHKCYACRGQFTVRKGTVFEDSPIPLHIWFQAAHLMCSSKKGISSNQLHRVLGVTLKTAWFMSHRLREAMREGKLSMPLGGRNKVVEADTTWVGGKEKNKHSRKRTNRGRGTVGKEAAFSLIERDGRVRSFHLPAVNAKTLKPILKAQIDQRSYLMTDDGGEFRKLKLANNFGGHGTVNHSAGEYVRTGGFHHTNTIENYFSILKRGITGTYHHVSQQHLKRYLAEFDFRHNERAALGVNDGQRTTKALSGIVGKRLMYKDSSPASI